LEVVGKGGFGMVLKAFDEKLHRIVAIKVLSMELSANGTARQRFIREARTAAAVAHEHVVTIHAVVEEHRPPYLVMQLIDGVTLQQKLDKSGFLSLREILRIGMQMAEGLAAAHKQGLVHRDIKPANILLENGVERVKITDFGLARAVDDASVTQSGTVAGTPMYMSPEQAEGVPLDHRSAVFSLGTVLYAMCTGHPPFRASGTHAVLKRVIDASPRPIREINSEIPDWLCDIIAKLHAKKPADRFQTAKEVSELLGQHLAHLQQPDSAPKPAPIEMLAGNVSDEPAVLDLLEGHDTTRRALQHMLAIGGTVLGLLDVYVGIVHGPGADAVYWLFFGALACFIAAAWVKQRWEKTYRGHRIRFENSWYTGEALYIDGVLVDRCGTGPRRQLSGLIAEGEGAGDVIVAFPETTLASVGCRIVAERQHGPMTPARAADEARRRRAVPSAWGRLGRIGVAHAVPLVLLFSLIAAYSDSGWWSTPWLEWIAAPVLGLWALWQLVRGVRPRWLPVYPAIVAVVLAALGWALWPYSTSREFGRLVHEGRYRDASQMIYVPWQPGDADAWHFVDDRVLTVPPTKGEPLNLSEADLPLVNRKSSWSAFMAHLRNDPTTPFSFQLTSKATGNPKRQCDVHLLARNGKVTCTHIAYWLLDNLNSWRSVTQAEWLWPPPALAVAPFDNADAKGLQQAWVKHLSVPVQTTNSIGMKLGLIPPGEFEMGPGYRPRITRPYRMGIHRVTVGQFKQFVNE